MAITAMPSDTDNRDSVIVSLRYAVEQLHPTGFSVMIIQSYAVAIMCVNGCYFFFDSHSRDVNGNMVADGTSVLIPFNQKSLLVKFLVQYATNIGLQIPDCQNAQISILNVSNGFCGF